MRAGGIPFLLVLGISGGSNDLTPEIRQCIGRAHEWILEAQNRDGGWGLDGRTESDITCTSLAALALMSGSSTSQSGPHPKAVQAVHRALKWIMERTRRSRIDIAGGNVTLIQSKLGTNVHTFFATVFLSQILGMQGSWIDAEKPEEIRAALVRMTESIAKTQEADGSWHKDAFGSLKATAMAWLALRSCQSAGLSAHRAAADKTVAFIRKQFDSGSGLFMHGNQRGYGGYQTIYASASALRVLCGMGEAQGEIAQKGASALIKTLKSAAAQGVQFLQMEGEDFLAATMLTQALLHEEGRLWKEWYPWVSGQLIKKQNRDGSWTGTACISGRTFPTACALLALQVPYKVLPLQEM
jgi:hypothetical protein